MKRIYACIGILIVLITIAFYSSYQVELFSQELSQKISIAIDSLDQADQTTAQQQISAAAKRCRQMRDKTNHLLRTEDFSELEASLRAAEGHLQQNAPEEALGELRRAQVQVETLSWLAKRFV